jgi:predicted small secreted protein
LVAVLVLERFGVDRVKVRMKRIRMFGLTLGMALGFAAAAFAAEPSEAELMKQAKITKTEAEQIARAKVSHGIVKSAEIEKEKGHLVWSFDIARPGTHDITEVLVDAKTGKIISTRTESPRDQAKEAAADKKQN